VPVLHLGPRTQHAAHLLIHSLRQLLAPDCLPLFTSDGLNLYFYAALGPFRTVARRTSSREDIASMAGGGGLDLWSGEKKLPTTQAGTCHARDAPLDTGRSQNRLAGTRFLWKVEHRFHRAGESDRPTWSGSAGSSNLGHFPTGSTPARPSGVLARLLSFCAPSPITASSSRAAGSREVVDFWRNAIGSGQKLWQRGEPPDDGRRARCSLVHCHWFPLERQGSQVQSRYHVLERSVKGPAEEVRQGLTPW
jgi:hypothetical protein